MAAHAHDDDGSSIFPHQKTLAKECHCSATTVWRVLQEFKSRQWIAIKRTIRSNRYQILRHGAVDPELAVKLAAQQAHPEPAPDAMLNLDNAMRYQKDTNAFAPDANALSHGMRLQRIFIRRISSKNLVILRFFLSQNRERRWRAGERERMFLR